MSFNVIDSPWRGTQGCDRKRQNYWLPGRQIESAGPAKRLFSYHSGFTRKLVKREAVRRREVGVTWGAVNQASSLRQVFACFAPNSLFSHPTLSLLPGTSGQVTPEPLPTIPRMLRGWPLGSQRMTRRFKRGTGSQGKPGLSSRSLFCLSLLLHIYNPVLSPGNTFSNFCLVTEFY